MTAVRDGSSAGIDSRWDLDLRCIQCPRSALASFLQSDFFLFFILRWLLYHSHNCLQITDPSAASPLTSAPRDLPLMTSGNNFRFFDPLPPLSLISSTLVPLFRYGHHTWMLSKAAAAATLLLIKQELIMFRLTSEIKRGREGKR